MKQRRNLSAWWNWSCPPEARAPAAKQNRHLKPTTENLSDAQKTYLAALETARKEKLEAIKEAEADYVAAVKAAQDALKASKEAINASSN